MNPLLGPLAAGFRLGVALRNAAYGRGWVKTRRLAAPVISVGNLTVGGTGKTPLVALVAEILLRKGWKPGILTRGYGRRGNAEMVIVAPQAGRRANAWEIGDEPALLARALPQVPLVVCADRFRGGRVAEERFRVDAHILDDGFQHLALARDVDLVALDASAPLSDLVLLPAGRAREPLAALARAHLVVITRADFGNSEALEEMARGINSRLRVFHSSTRLVEIVDAFTGATVPPEEWRGQKTAAFCGIGNHRAFFRDVRRWGFDLVAEDAFPDHHRYTERELERLLAVARKFGAKALVTTEKDAVRLPGRWTPTLAVWACSISSTILEAECFEDTLLTHLQETQRAHR